MCSLIVATDSHSRGTASLDEVAEPVQAAAGTTRRALWTAGAGTQSAPSSGDWPRPRRPLRHTCGSETAERGPGWVVRSSGFPRGQTFLWCGSSFSSSRWQQVSKEKEASLPQTSTLWSGFIPLHSVCVCSPSERKRRCKLEGWPPDQESRRRLSKQALAAAAWRAACSQPRVTQGSLPESSAGLCGISGLPGLPDQNDPERNGHKNALCAKVYKAFFYTFYP